MHSLISEAKMNHGAITYSSFVARVPLFLERVCKEYYDGHINYVPNKSHVIIFITQGQIVQIYLIRIIIITIIIMIIILEMQHGTVLWKIVALIPSAKQKPHKIPFCLQ